MPAGARASTRIPVGRLRRPPSASARRPRSPSRHRATVARSSSSCEGGHQTHAPGGTRWISPHRLPAGRIFVGFARPDGSNASRNRACASRSSTREHQRHRFALLEPDAMFSREHAAGRDAHGEDLVACTVHPFPDARLARVEHDERMQVAVAGVEHVHHRESLLVGDRVHLAQHVDRAWSGAPTASWR